MVKYGETLLNALKFSVEPKRWVPFFAIDLIFSAVMLAYLLSNIFVLKGILSGDVSGLVIASSIIGVIAVSILMFAVWLLLRLYVSGALVHQSFKPKEFSKSWTVSKQRFLSLLAVSIVVGIISGVVGIVPYVGWILSIIIGLMFFFVAPAVIVKKMVFDKALSDSYRIFRKKPLDVFLIWLLLTIISGLIFLLFFIPMLVVMWSVLLPILLGLSGGTATITGILTILTSNIWYIVPAMLVMIVGIAIGTVFSFHAQTHFYIQLKKKRGIF